MQQQYGHQEKKHKKTGENTETSSKASPKLKWTVIQREAADTGSYNIRVKEGKRRSNSSVYRVMKGLEKKLDSENLLIWDTRDTGGYGKKVELPTMMHRSVEWFVKRNSGCKKRS